MHDWRQNLGRILLGTAIIAGGLAVAPPTASAEPSGSVTFSYTGAPQSWTVPAGVSAIAVDASGGQGGEPNYGGLGARVRATLPVSPDDVLQINVGGAGGLGSGGFNGGGYSLDGGYGGGGASDVRKGGVQVANRVVVAGGGGGAGKGAGPVAGPGGGGGAPNGTDGQAAPCGAGGGGGTQAAGGNPGGGDWKSGNAGSLAQGANSPNGGGGGGGGGYYGGGSGGGCLGPPVPGGGGGSSWVAASASGARYDQGVRQGNGTLTISWPPATTPPVTPSPGSATFSYTGAPQWLTVPPGVSAVAVDLYGAQGGQSNYGGLGARVRATVAVSPGDLLQVNVGGAGAQNAAGFNGGGYPLDGGYGGGGASDIRKNGVTVADRVAVAGGGGGAGLGAGTLGGPGGAGGAPNGSAGQGTCGAGGGGATQTAGGAAGGGDWRNGYPGSLAQGANGQNAGGGAGGGGYYGGGSGGGCVWGPPQPGGGGGSSWASTAASAVRYDQGVRQGAGSVTISWPPATTPPVLPSPGSSTFSYTGAPQWLTVPNGVGAVTVDLSGGQGGGTTGGLGARVRATLAVSPGEVLQVNVGGAGSGSSGGFNGGGSGLDGGLGGGGASDIRKSGGTLADRVVVAAAGGGGTGTGPGGAGGAPDGTAGFSTCGAGGGGATQTAGGAAGGGDWRNGYAGGFAQGANGQNGAGGAGGGGYYGGGSGGGCVWGPPAPAGGGGSSWISPLVAIDGSMTSGINAGNGSVTISWPAPRDSARSFGIDSYGEFVHQVFLGSGNLVEQATDVDIETAGPDLSLSRTYNSLDSTPGWFGVGWSSTYEQSAAVDATSGDVTIRYPDGRKETHKFNAANGTYTAPVGYVSKLASRTGGGWTLTQKDRSVTTFDGQGRLIGQTDRYGHTLTFTWTAGQLTSVTDGASSRSLTFTWAGARLETVSTNAVSGPGYSGPLTWRYVYSGDLLTKVCDPRNNDPITGSCTTYGYTGGKLTSITRPKGNPSLAVAYKGDGRVDWTRNGVGNEVHYDYYDGVSTVTDARGYVSHYFYDPLYRTTLLIDPAGGLTSYSYDANGFRSKVTDPNGHSVTLGYDARGNLTSQTNAEGETTWFAYDASDNLTVKRDGRSSGSTDDQYKTTFTYNAAGDKLTETSPPTAEDPSGVTQTWTYTAGGEDLGFGAGVPAGLLRSHNNGTAGGTTWYAYDPAGDLRSQTEPSGLVQRFDRDNLGRVTTGTVVWDGGQTAVTTRTWDQLGHPLTVTEPAVTNTAVSPPVTNQRQTINEYDGNGNLWRITVHDAGGSSTPTPDRVTVVDFDNADRPWRTTDPEGGITSRTFDSNGNVATVTDAEGRVHRTDYDERNRPVAVTLLGFVDDPIGGSTPRDVVVQRTDYDPAGRKTAEYSPRANTGGGAGQLDPAGTPMAKRRYTYDKADRLLTVTLEAFGQRLGGTADVVLESYSYDDAGNKTNVAAGNGLATTANTFDEAGRLQTATLEMGAVDRVSDFDYDPTGKPTRQTVTQGSSVVETRTHYDSAGRPDSQTVENGAADLTTTVGYDQRGLRIWTVDPRGTQTDYAYDPAGRLVQEQAPTVSIEAVGGSAVSGRPTVKYGYDAASNRVAAVDPRGALTRQSFDRLDRRTRIDHPTYTPPGGTALSPFEEYGYDKVGNLIWSKDRRGQVTDYRFDARNRVVRQLDPQVAGQPARGATLYAYDDAGNRTSQTDPTGAAVTVGYDDLNRPRTRTQVVRQDAPAGSYTTTFDYDALGHQTFQSDPSGVSTTSGYNAASELTSVTDSLNKTTTFGYDAAGRRTSEVDPLGRRTEHVFDPAGRETATVWKEPGTGTVLATEHRTFDSAGNVTAYRSPRSASAIDDTYKTSYAYDAANRLTSVTEPDAAAPITTSYGYDAAGNVTRLTDGRGNTTTYTWTPWNTPESTVEPPTPGQTADADRTFTLTADAAGLPVTETQPGVTIGRTFDALGRLTDETGSGAGVTNASRTFGYDLAGRRTAVSHPAGTIGLGHDDRSLLLWASLPGSAQVASSFRYDPAGRLTNRTDAAGTTTFTYTGRGELDVATDPLTGLTTNFDWNDAGQPATATYNTNPAAVRTYAYDARGWLDIDELKAGETALAKANYDYDPDGNLTGQTITAPGNPAAGAHAYSYDRSGRLDSWTAAGGAVTDYGYDATGNRITAGNVTSAYDARNRLLSQTAFDTTAPTVPSGVAATAAGPRQVNLTWTASTDANGVAGYTVLRDGVVVGTTSETSFSDMTVTPSTSYSYTAEAYDAAANRSAASTASAAATPATSTVTFVEPASSGGASSATGVSVNKPTNATVGDVLVAVVAVSGTPTVTASDWTQQNSRPNGTAMTLVTFTRRVAAGETGPYSFGRGTTGSIAVAIGAYRGVSGIVPLDGIQSQANASSKTVTAPSITTTMANDMLVGGFAIASQATFTQPSGMAERADQVSGATSPVAVELADLALTSAGATGTKAATATVKAVNVGVLLALRRAGTEPADTTAPSTPASPAAAAASGPVQVGLTWAAATDNTAVIGYRINRGGTLIGWSSTASFTDTKVNANTAYSYTVEAVDGAGNRSPASAAANVTTGNVAGGTIAESYTWSGRGTMTGVTAGAGTTPVAFDGLGRQITWGATSYTYDALDRIATRGGTAFSYAGTAIDPTAVGGESFSRTPGGDLLAMRNGTTARLAGENRHGDLAWLLGPDGTVTDSRIWDPYGQAAGATGTTSPSVGYQGDYTDPASGDVWMGARWYQPDTGTFTSRDTVFGMLETPISLNRYTYAAGDPLQYFDPDGHWPSLSGLKKAVTKTWDNTGGRVVSAVNNHVVETIRSAPASAKAAVSKVATAGRTYLGKAVSTVRTVRRFRDSAREQVARHSVGSVRGFARAAADTALGIRHLATNPTELVHLAKALRDDPVGTASKMGHGFADPLADAWKRGEYGEVSGRLAFEVPTAIAGLKGADKAARFGTRAVKGLKKATPAPRTAPPSAFNRTEALAGNASSRQVREMADAMRANGWDGPPIRVVEVDGKPYVVDGHHRVAAARQAGIDVQYEVVDPATVIGPGQWRSVDEIVGDANAVGPDQLRRPR